MFYLGQNILVEFKIWERGNIDINAFEKDLMKNLQIALCDVLLEYRLFCSPICSIPKHLQSSVHSSRRESMAHRASFSHPRGSVHSSCSSNATTPKLSKAHMPLKKFFSEPTTPSDINSQLLAPEKTTKTQDDLSLISESPRGSFPKDYVSGMELNVEEVEKRNINSQLNQQKRESSPGILKKKISRYIIFGLLKFHSVTVW